MEEAPTKETSATPTMETLSITESGISTGLSGVEGSSACCDTRPRLTWEGRLDLEKELSMQYPKEETNLAERLGIEAEANECLMLSPLNLLEDSRNEILRRMPEKRINRMMKDRGQRYYSCDKCCQKAFPEPQRSSQNTSTNPDSDLGEALKGFKKLQLSPGYHQNPDDLWKDLEAFEKLQPSLGCQNSGDTSQDI